MRIKRLGYFEDVNIETPPVPGTPDQVDVEVTVTEKSTGNLLAGVGYSSADGIVFNASVSQQNIFGTGNALIAAINTSQVNRTISLAFTEPYWTVDGVSRTLELYQRNIDPSSLASSQYKSQTLGGAVGFGVPITETDTINFGVRVEHTDLDAVRQTARRSTASSSTTFGYADQQLHPVRRLVARHARRHPLSDAGTPAERSAPRSACRSATFRTTRSTTCIQWFSPLPTSDFVLMLRGDLGYGDGYSAASRCRSSRRSTPAASARCAATRRLRSGRRTSTATRLGGKAKIVGNAELFYPILKGDKSVRAAVFADAGQIYGIRRNDCCGQPSSSSGFRYSAGVGLAVEFADRSAQVQLRLSAQPGSRSTRSSGSSSRSARCSRPPACAPCSRRVT